MRLPPQALTAPALCPRCDAPATLPDHCIQCGLPLRRCPRCQGVAGPFDRYCGFCGHDMVDAAEPSPAWRLWLLVALVPIIAGIAFGLSPYSQDVARRVGGIVGGTPAPSVPAGFTALRTESLGFTYAAPSNWTAADLSRADATPKLPEVLVTSVFSDQQKLVADGRADLVAATPAGTAVELGRPGISAPGVDATDPLAILQFQVGQLTATPPAGARVEVVESPHLLSIGGHRAATAVLRITRGTDVRELQRTWVSLPSGLLRVDGLASESSWTSGDQARLQSIVASVR